MKEQLILSCCLFFLAFHQVAAAQAPPSLSTFFQQRLKDTPEPTYEVLLQVIDPIATSDPQSITDALPFIATAMTSNRDDVTIEAGMALYAISLRPDGAALLREHIPRIGMLLSNPDERISGMSILVLQQLSSPSNTDLIMPIIIKYLNGPAKPGNIKTESVFMILRLSHTDPVAMKVVHSFLTATMDSSVRTNTLFAIHRAHFVDPVITAFVLQSLTDPSKHVKKAAIGIVRDLGPDAWNQALPIMTKILNDRSEDAEVRSFAERAIKNDTAPVTVGPPPRPDTAPSVGPPQ